MVSCIPLSAMSIMVMMCERYICEHAKGVNSRLRPLFRAPHWSLFRATVAHLRKCDFSFSQVPEEVAWAGDLNGSIMMHGDCIPGCSKR